MKKLTLTIFLFLVCLTSCHARNVQAAPTAPVASDNGTLDVSKLPDSQSQIRGWSYPELIKGNYRTIDAAAEHWRTTKSEYDSGGWKLHDMYEGLGFMVLKKQFNNRAIKNLREWVDIMPKSITARVALAQALVNEATTKYDADRYPENVASAAKRRVDGLAEARLVLREAKKLDAKCPHWWQVAQQIAFAQKWPRDAYNGLFEEAVAFEPDYYPYYFHKALSLHPNWGGRVGDSEQFSLDAAKKVGGDKGAVLYVRLMRELHNLDLTMKTLAGPKVSFEMLNRGSAVLDKQYPNNFNTKMLWLLACYLSGSFKNEEARKARARRLWAEMEKLSRIEEIVPPETEPWRTSTKPIREWAFEE